MKHGISMPSRLVPGFGLACLPLLSCQPIEPRIEAAPTRESLEADLAQIAELRRGLAAQPFTVEALRRELGPGSSFEERDLGFGVRRLELTLFGAHTFTRVAAFAALAEPGHESPIASVEIEQRGRDESWASIAPDLVHAWNPLAAERGELSLRVARVDTALDAALRERIATELGGVISGVLAVEPPQELASAFRVLTDPLAKLAVGTSCGFVGLPPLGSEQAAALVNAGRFDLLRAVLRGPNPEARVYAAHALTAHPALDATDAAAIARLSRLPLKLETCQGCVLECLEWDGAMQVLAER